MSANHTPVSSNDKLLALLCHLSSFIGFPLLIPLVIYLVKKDESRYLSANASEALNFHLSSLIYLIGLVVLGVAMCGSGLEGRIWMPIAVGIIWMILFYLLAIIAAIKSADGFIFRYPLTIRFIGEPRSL